MAADQRKLMASGSVDDTNPTDGMEWDAQWDNPHRTNREQDDSAPLMLQSTIITAASKAVISGESLEALKKLPSDRRVSFKLKIENLTRFPLINPYVSVQAGEIHSPPVDVDAGYREGMVGRKVNWSTHGTYGTVSWEIGDGKKRRLVIMWCCPHDFVFNDRNWLGVGVGDSDCDVDTEQIGWYDVMFTNAKSKERTKFRKLDFESRRFFREISPIQFTDSEGLFHVFGTMSEDHEATAIISFRPVKKEDFAPSLVEQLAK